MLIGMSFDPQETIIFYPKNDFFKREITFALKNLIFSFIPIVHIYPKDTLLSAFCQQPVPSTFTALGLAVCVGFLYYVVNAVSLAFGKGGFFPPVIAAWITPMIFAAMAMTLIETKSLN